MKVQKSKLLSAFGGINFVFDYLETQSIEKQLNQCLPEMAEQSKYTWKDILYSVLSIHLCGGDHIEDLQTHLKNHFIDNPFVNLPSPDTVLRRLKDLSVENKKCKTERGIVEHVYNTNEELGQLNIKMLKQLKAFDTKELTIDYDNTIIFNEKKDSLMTYKRNPGYQPGVCTINENQILYIENRNGNSDAKSFQHNTLKRMFDMIKKQGIRKADHFRADAASYQYEVVRLVEEEVKSFYIGCRNSYVEKYFSEIEKWGKMINADNKEIEVGEIIITPFQPQSAKKGEIPRPYRLIVKRSIKENGQINVFTNDAYEYRAILTNDICKTPIEVAIFYNHRGNMERQFDFLKNDFGWNNMPFSKLSQNTVYLYITAICRNLYYKIINHFGQKVKGLKQNFRVKKFLFRFIILPAKWVKRSRQLSLRVFGDIPI